MGKTESSIPIVTLPNGKQFPAETSETMLDAGLRAGLVLEHSCKTGRCGSCKTQVTAGSTNLLFDESGLNQAERQAGWILTCARSATSDIQLNIEECGDIQLFPAKTLPCRIQSLDLLAPDVLRVSLRLPPNQQFQCHPGQSIDLIGKDGLRRSYSVANSTAGGQMPELHIRQVDGGAMSRYWFAEAKANDLLRINGPLGTFFLRDVAGLDLICLATGTGMAPIKAMLEGLAAAPAARLPRSISVFWGGRLAQDLYWNPADAGLELKYFPVLSRADASWQGLRGHVQQAVLASNTPLQNAAVYACGSLAMIDSARTLLVAAGLGARRFYADAFVSSSHTLKVNP